jgi:hypothetical protein
MTISLIATASTDAATGNVAITHGLTIAAGDVIIALVNGNGSGQTTTDNNGATPFTSADSAANPDSATAYVFYRVCGDGEPSTYNFTQGSSSRWSIILRQYRGVGSTVWDVAPAAANRAAASSAATAVAPAITIATTGAAGLVLMADDRYPTTTTYTSVDNSYGNAKSESGQQYTATVDRLDLSTGTTGTTTITSSAYVSYVIWQCALKPILNGVLNQTQAANTIVATGEKLTGGISGVLLQTQANNTIIATGEREPNGSLNQTQAANTIVATGALKVQGILTQSQAANTPAMTGALKIQGVLLQSQTGNTIISAGILALKSVLSQAQAANTITATGALKIQGAVNQSQADNTPSMTSISRKRIIHLSQRARWQSRRLQTIHRRIIRSWRRALGQSVPTARWIYRRPIIVLCLLAR